MKNVKKTQDKLSEMKAKVYIRGKKDAGWE